MSRHHRRGPTARGNAETGFAPALAARAVALYANRIAGYVREAAAVSYACAAQYASGRSVAATVNCAYAARMDRAGRDHDADSVNRTYANRIHAATNMNGRNATRIAACRTDRTLAHAILIYVNRISSRLTARRARQVPEKVQ